MEPPFLVLRERVASGAEVVTTIPLAELFSMIRAARAGVAIALSGDPRAKGRVEEILARAAAPSAEARGRAVIAAYLLKEALDEAEEGRAMMQAQQAQQAEQQKRAQWEAQQCAEQQRAAQPQAPPMQAEVGASPQHPAHAAAAARRVEGPGAAAAYEAEVVEARRRRANGAAEGGE